MGGTGGHVLPAMQIGRRLSEKYAVIYVGVGLAKNRFFAKEGLCYYDIEGAGLGGGMFVCGKKNVQGLLQAKRILEESHPKMVLGFGSFHSFPVLAAALYLNIPYSLFEFNTVPGRVNRLFSRKAKTTFINFDSYRHPLRGEITKIGYAFEEKKNVSQQEARAHFGLRAEKKTLLVFGGSQGADAINDVVLKGAAKWKGEFQVLHFPGKETNAAAIYQQWSIPCYVTPFCHNMDLAWAAADIAICRSGAGALREMLIYEKPAILIPYPQAKDDHQTYNARYMTERVGGAIHLPQQHVTPESITQAIFACTRNSISMQRAIQQWKQLEQRPSIYNVIAENL